MSGCRSDKRELSLSERLKLRVQDLWYRSPFIEVGIEAVVSSAIAAPLVLWICQQPTNDSVDKAVALMASLLCTAMAYLPGIPIGSYIARNLGLARYIRTRPGHLPIYLGILVGTYWLFKEEARHM